ncbi:MAG TPA: tetratricopeptide repeat protein [Candidatus Baltobacteraceae bacterium]|nr:tetratricopeptide repeat protein [Candidatus Baltobacteraceae bacterium]
MSPLSEAALHSRAVAAFARRDYAEAEALLRRILVAQPGDRAARFNLAKVYEVTERYDAAAELYGSIVAGAPDDAPALLRLGTVRYVQGRLEDAADAFAAALRAAPDDPTAALNLGIVLNAVGRFESAAHVLRTAAGAHPAIADIRCALAEALRELHRDGEAAAEANAALAIEPGHVSARVVLGQVAYDRGDFDEAERCFAAAADDAPQRAEPRLNLGVLYHGLGRYGDALANAEAAVALAPGDPLAHFDLGLTLLLGGHYERGFAEAEWRLRDPRARAQFARVDAIPRWNGERLDGKRLLVAREQGLGDFVLWSRLFGEAARRSNARVAVEMPPGLGDLYDGFPGIDDAFEEACPEDELARADAHVPLCSLPYVLRVGDPERAGVADGGRFGAGAVPYLLADRVRVQAFRERFARERGAVKVGVAWRGDPAHLLDRFRSCSLDAFASLRDVADVAWISLQKGAHEAEALEPPPDFEVLALGPELRTFADTAAAIAALDLVVAVDTSVVHLAGALGTPVWMLHGFGNYWLWGLEGGGSPWYPTLRVFRQHRPNDWTGVFADVRAELRSFVAARERD